MALSQREWARIKAIQPSTGKVVHSRGTLNIGRNAQKQQARSRGSRHIGKAARAS